MALTKLQITPGVNREGTRYTSEGQWYETEKVRFRGGLPEKIGGWVRLSDSTFEGVCRSLRNWVTLSGKKLIGVGTHLRFYIARGGDYFDITPLRASSSLTGPFTTTSGSTTVTVTDVAHDANAGDYVIFSGATAVGGLTIDGEYTIATIQDVNTYTITAASTATSGATGGGSVTADYLLHVGASSALPVVGWGAGGYGFGQYGIGNDTVTSLRLWSQSNFGEDLVFNYRGGPLCWWDASGTVSARGALVSAISGASEVPTVVLRSLVSDVSRFVFAFGCNDVGGTDLDPLLIRWSDQEDLSMWMPKATNQAGSLRLSNGSEIITGIQARQEVLVWTNSALYGLQYLGAPEGWGAQILGENVSIASPNAAVFTGGAAFWMGQGKFYSYDGTVLPLQSTLRRYVFNDFNREQYAQVFAASNEAFNEVWWFYCSGGSTTVDRYVVYNYVENLWYYGSMARTAWIDSGIVSYPIAASYNNKLLYHENGVDDRETATAQPIVASATSSMFDIGDGHRFAFIRRILPDVAFSGSTSSAPAVTLTLQGLKNAGAGYQSPVSQGGEYTQGVTRTSTSPVDQFTGQVFVRVRARQIVFKIESSDLGVQWQLGAPRLDMRLDGRK